MFFVWRQMRRLAPVCQPQEASEWKRIKASWAFEEKDWPGQQTFSACSFVLRPSPVCAWVHLSLFNLAILMSPFAGLPAASSLHHERIP